MSNDINLTTVTRDDVTRIASWLEDTAVNSMWYGLGKDRTPLHIGYNPRSALNANEETWNRLFKMPERLIKSIYAHALGHIGEIQLFLNPLLKEAELFILIGKKEAWGHRYRCQPPVVPGREHDRKHRPRPRCSHRRVGTGTSR